MTFFGHRERSSGHPPRGIRVRPGTSEDEFTTFEVMGRAMGYDMTWQHHAGMRHHLRNSPRMSYWVAEETPRFGAPRVVGYARSVVRERVWNLTEFFVLPDHHQKGIGGALLARCVDEGVAFGADTRFVLASHNAAADSLYIRKAGCFPRVPMLLMIGSPDSLRSLPDNYPRIAIVEGRGATVFSALNAVPTGDASSDRVTAEPVVLTADVQAEIDRLDRDTVGYARPFEHTQWAAEMGGPNGAARLFRRPAADSGRHDGLKLVGYAYIGLASSGPALALQPPDLPAMLSYVTSLAASSARLASSFGGPRREQYWAVPGVNEVVLSWLLLSGWRIVFQYLFMSSRPMGRLDRYVCFNPLYVL